MPKCTPIDRFPTDICYSENASYVTWIHCDKLEYELRMAAPDNIEGAQVITRAAFPEGIGDVCAASDVLAWTRVHRGQWSLELTRVDHAAPREVIALPLTERCARHPVVATLADGDLIVVWWQLERGGSSVHAARLDNSGALQRPPIQLSLPGVFSCRPALCAMPGGDAVAVVYDQYSSDYQLTSCFTDGERVWNHASPFADTHDCLLGDIVCDGAGQLWATALELRDVMTETGIVDQVPGARMAVLKSAGWRDLNSADRPAVVLADGMLARQEPTVPVWGYLGNRRRPMLRCTPSGVPWLLWEMKAVHDGPTRTTVGRLLGVPVDEPLGPCHLLHEGYRLYDAVFVDEFTLSVAGRGATQEEGILLQQTQVKPASISPFELRAADKAWLPTNLPENVDDRRDICLPEAAKTNLQLYWGDPHVHTGASADAEGEPDELFHYARDNAGLDFVVFQDNDCYMLRMTGHEYNMSLVPAQLWSEDDGLTVLAGWEWTLALPGAPPNHRTCVYDIDHPTVLHWPDADGDCARMAECVRQEGGIPHFHHREWQPADNETEANAEAASAWSIYFDDPGRIHEALDEGRRIGFFGGSDSHRFNPGLCGALTGVWARDASKTGIMQAFREHRCFATSGARIALYSTLNGSPMGTSLQLESGQAISLCLDVDAPDVIAHVELIMDGSCIQTFAGDDAVRMSLSHELLAEPGAHWLYWKVTLVREEAPQPANLSVARGRYAWASPHWFHVH